MICKFLSLCSVQLSCGQPYTITMAPDLFEPSTWAEVEDAEQSAKYMPERRSPLCKSILSFTSSPEKYPTAPIDPTPSLYPSLSAPQASALLGKPATEFEDPNLLDGRAISLPRDRLMRRDNTSSGRRRSKGGEEIVNPKHFEDLLGMGRVDLETDLLVRRYARGRRGKGERRWVKGKSIGVQGVGGLVNPAGEEFDAESYLARVHGGTAVKDLMEGLESLKSVEEMVESERAEVVKGMRGRALLVAEDFEAVLKEKRGSLKITGDVERVEKEYKRIWTKVLERKAKLDRLKRVQAVVRKHREIFELPRMITEYADSVEQEKQESEDQDCSGYRQDLNTAKTISVASANEISLIDRESDEDKKLIGTITIRKLSELLKMYASAQLFLSCQTHTIIMRPLEDLLRNSMAKLISALQGRLQRPQASKTQLMNALSVLLTICPESARDKNRRTNKNDVSRPYTRQQLDDVSLHIVKQALNQRLTNSLQIMQTHFLPKESLLPVSKPRIVTPLSSASMAFASSSNHFWSLSSAVLSLPATREVRKECRAVIAKHLSHLLEQFDKLNPFPLRDSFPLPTLSHLSQFLEVTGQFCKRSLRLGIETEVEGLQRFVGQVKELAIRFLNDVQRNVRSSCRLIGERCQIGVAERMLERVRWMVDEVEGKLRKGARDMRGNKEGPKGLEEGLGELRRALEVGLMEAADALLRRGLGLEEKLVMKIAKMLRNQLTEQVEGEDLEWKQKKEKRLNSLCERCLEEAVALRLARCRKLLVQGVREKVSAGSRLYDVRDYVKEVTVLVGIELTKKHREESVNSDDDKIGETILRVVGNEIWRAVGGIEWDRLGKSQIAQVWIDLKVLEGAFGNVREIEQAVKKTENEIRRRGVEKAKRERWEAIVKQATKELAMVRSCLEECKIQNAVDVVEEYDDQ